jgi:serine/threonine-protein kinase
MDSTTIESVHGRVGTTVRGRWVLGPVIGAGGTAAVYEGTHRINGKKVAVKVMHSFLASSDDLVARFQREGYIANKVGHPGAVAILDDDTTDDGAPFLVMDRLEGEPLARILDHASDGLAVGQALSIVHDVLDILGAAHARGIVHRDIKPDNVFLTTAGRIMVLDFGIARLHERVLAGAEGGTDMMQRPAARTQDGSALGTPQYMPPEQARGRWSEVDAQSDLWSVGAMMFRLLTGKPVRQQRGAADMLLSAMTEQAPSIRAFASVPPEVAAIVDKALAFDKKDRWADARAMQDAIREAAGRIGVPNAKMLVSSLAAPTKEAAAPAAPARRSRAMAVLAAATLLLAGIALAMKPLEAVLRPSVGPTSETSPTSPSLASPPELAPTSLPTEAAEATGATEDIQLDPVESAAQHRGLPFHRRHGHAGPGTVVPARPAESAAAAPPSPSSLLDRRH